MKIVVSDTLGYYSNYLIPPDRNDCRGLISAVITGVRHDEAFQKQINLARFIFDEVETHTPDYRPEGDDILLCQALHKIRHDGVNTLPVRPEDAEEKIRQQLRKDFLNEAAVEQVWQIVDRIAPSPEATQGNWLLTPDPFFARRRLEGIEHFDKQAVLSVLATCGVDFVLPSVFIKEDEEIERFKEKFAEERAQYIRYLLDQADEFGRMMRDGQVAAVDLLDYARRNVAVELQNKAEIIEAAVAHEGKNALKHMWADFRKKLPTIGTSLAAAVTAGEKLAFVPILGSLIGTLAAGFNGREAIDQALKDHPEAAYLYRIKSR